MSAVVQALEQYLTSIDPERGAAWRGASDHVARIQALTPFELPPVYLWFLRRMGADMGKMAFPTGDFTAEKVLAAYADPEDEIGLGRRYLMIGYTTDELMPLHVFYDLEKRVRDDALVFRSFMSGSEQHLTFETFSEMLAWGKALRFRVYTHPRHCKGSMEDLTRAPFARLDLVMRTLGFEQPVVTGDFCRVYERDDATMVCKGSLDGSPRQLRFFKLGASREAIACSILGTIALETGMSLKIQAWGDAAPR